MIHTNDKVIKHKVAADQGGVDALFDRNRRSPNIMNRVGPAIESVVLEYALEERAYGQTVTSNELRKLGTFASSSVSRQAALEVSGCDMA